MEQGQSGARGYRNVFANGIVATAAAVLFGVFQQPVFIVMYVGCVATAAADTLASEIGVTGGIPFMITTLKKVPIGTNGGVTLVGESVALLGGLVISLAAFFLGVITLPMVLVCTLAGFVGHQYRQRCRGHAGEPWLPWQCGDKPAGHDRRGAVRHRPVPAPEIVVAGTLQNHVKYVIARGGPGICVQPAARSPECGTPGRLMRITSRKKRGVTLVIVAENNRGISPNGKVTLVAGTGKDQVVGTGGSRPNRKGKNGPGLPHRVSICTSGLCCRIPRLSAGSGIPSAPGPGKKHAL